MCVFEADAFPDMCGRKILWGFALLRIFVSGRRNVKRNIIIGEGKSVESYIFLLLKSLLKFVKID